jgi:S-adenosylmethionine decarboxylase proenzyme
MSRPLGKHVLVEYFGCDVGALSDREELRRLMLEATRLSGATIVTDVFHEFNPYGLSGVVVIAESHVAIHTWPEHACASLDVFTCGEKMDPYAIKDYLEKALHARETLVSELERGLPRGAERHGRWLESCTAPPYDPSRLPEKQPT